MMLHSYATDTQAEATDLASTVAAAVSPLQIASACAAVDSFLRKHAPDQQRWFFAITFPALICRIFGFDDSSPPSATTKRHPSNGWIDVATSGNDSELSGRIFSLLSPNGLLLSSISGVDRLSLVKYVFPNERLPEWVRYMLQNERDCRVLTDLCPLFRNRIKEDPIKGSAYQVQLNVLEYYLFWFAYYPVSRGNSEGSETVKVHRTKKFRLENWSYSIPGLSSTKCEKGKKTECNLYIRLLYVYLQSFVPSQNLYVQPYRSSLLHYSPGYDSSAMERAEFVIHSMIHFWLVDGDFSPLPMSLCNAYGVTFPFRSVLGGETPPTSGLGDVINVFMKYLNLGSLVAMDGPDKAEVRSPGCRVSGSYDVVNTRDASLSINSIGSWNLMIQRPLYRFILRTFLFCPVESSIKNASQAFSLWVNYMEPWSISFEEFADLNETLGLPTVSSANSVNRSSTPGYASSWQGFVLDNYLFYSSLVMHFIGFAHKFLHTDTEIIVQMVAKVINILTSSVELMDLIKNVDTVFHSKAAAEPSKWMLTGVNRYIPTIRQQLQVWEDGLCESDADGSFLHENWNRDLRLFADGEDGGQHLLQLFLLRAESELQSLSGTNLSQNLQCPNDIYIYAYTHKHVSHKNKDQHISLIPLITNLFIIFSLMMMSNSRVTADACGPKDSGDVVPTTPLVIFLERVQETALQTYGHKGFDPKLYVDMSLKQNLSATVEAFDKLPRTGNGSVSTEELSRFEEEYLGGAEEDLVLAIPVDFVAEPEEFLPLVKSPEVRAWALEVHGLWKNLSRKVSGRVLEKPDFHTLLPLENPVMIPGSRFREVYYWDSYWVIRGLLTSKMYETAKGIVYNLLSLIDEFGYVLNGARAYYTNRSQPPLLSSMVVDIYNTTRDKTLVTKSLPALLKEHAFWNSGVHKVIMQDAEGWNHSLSRYYARLNQPRPESSTIDRETASKLSNKCAKEKLYRELASAAESGWDFSTRWMRDESDLTTLATTSILPVDLNAFILKMELDITLLANAIGDYVTAERFREASDARRKAINSIFWNTERQQWFDYWLGDSVSSEEVHTWKASSQNMKSYASNFVPLWIDVFYSDVKLVDGVVESLENSGLVCAAGIATSLIRSGQQWDFPNGWAPLQHMIVEGLVMSGSEKARHVAQDIAVKWIRTNYVSYKKTGAMHEKYDVEKCGASGGGGEYKPQTGFGWSNGVVLAFLEEFGWPQDKKFDCS